MTSRFDTAVTLARHLLDPRGRCDRRAMFAVTVGLLAVQLAVAMGFTAIGGNVTGAPFLTLNALFMWVGAVATLKRLHDIGYSGWRIGPAVLFWLLGAIVIVQVLMFAVGPAVFKSALETYPALHALLAVIISLPPFGGLLWLQASAGEPGVNRFGPQPGADGFAHGHPKRRRDTMPADAMAA
jgi:uncharacterized membrane protein YhaH (DUF805 family)